MEATASSRFSDVDEYGFRRGEHFDYENYGKFMDKYLKTLTRRRIKWEAILKQNPDLSQPDAKLKRYIRKGIPGPFRTDVWMKISGAEAAMKKDLDYIDRLFNILSAYAHHNRDVGYCQGLNYIAGLLLIVTDDEEKSFWLLKHIVEDIAPQYHSHNMSSLLRDLAVFRELVIRRVPAVNRHIEKLELPYAVIASKWFICIFAEVLPVETVLRIWDCVFAEGHKVVFRAALAMFVTHKTAILACHDIAALVTLFRDTMIQDNIVTNCHSFIESMFSLRLTHSEIESLRKVAVLNAN